jgi:hypothetical protein
MTNSKLIQVIAFKYLRCAVLYEKEKLQVQQY